MRGETLAGHKIACLVKVSVRQRTRVGARECERRTAVAGRSASVRVSRCLHRLEKVRPADADTYQRRPDPGRAPGRPIPVSLHDSLHTLVVAGRSLCPSAFVCATLVRCHNSHHRRPSHTRPRLNSQLRSLGTLSVHNSLHMYMWQVAASPLSCARRDTSHWRCCHLDRALYLSAWLSGWGRAAWRCCGLLTAVRRRRHRHRSRPPNLRTGCRVATPGFTTYAGLAAPLAGREARPLAAFFFFSSFLL